MPWVKRKNADGTWKVVKKTDPSDVKMKSGSKADAEAQIRLLNAQEHGWTPTGGQRRRVNRRR